MDFCKVREFVLRKPSRFPQGANVRSHHGQKIHGGMTAPMALDCE